MTAKEKLIELLNERGVMQISVRPCVDIALKMHEWTKKQTIDEVVEWLSDHVNDYIINDKQNDNSRDWLKVKSDCFADLRKAMEE